MSAFTLSLPDGSKVSGKSFTPTKLQGPASRRPLFVGIPGGTYTTDFFDADANHSIQQWSEALGIPAVGLNRPGYDVIPAPTDMDKQSNTFIQKSGQWTHQVALPAVWDFFAKQFDVSSIVLYGHSIGGAVAIVAASQYKEGASPYKLSGLSVAGIGCDPIFNDAWMPMFRELHDKQEVPPAIPLRFPKEAQEGSMFGPHTSLYDPAILQQTERLAHPIYLQELYDVEFLWKTYWQHYAESVSVPFLYNMGEQDSLWHVDAETMRTFGAGFKNSPWVTTTISRNSPHCIEFSYQSSGYYIRLLGFAVECAAQREIKLRLEK